MKTVRSTYEIVILMKKGKDAGKWEINRVKYPLQRDYVSPYMMVYHTFEIIDGTKKEIEELSKQYPILYASKIMILR